MIVFRKRTTRAMLCLPVMALGICWTPQARASSPHASWPRASHAAVKAGLRGSVGGKPQGYLGIEFHDISDEQVKNLRLNSARGVEVVMVDHDGPAGKAGLRAHDVIVSLNGQAVAGEEAFRRMLHEVGAGVQIALTVFRSGQSLNLTAKLANRADVTRAAMAHLYSPDGPAPTSSPDGLQGAFGLTDRTVSAPPPPTAP